MNPLILKKMQEGVLASVFPGGVLLVAHKGTVCFHEAVGLAQTIPTAVPLDRDTLFDLASLTKPLAVASAFALVVGEQSLALTDPVSQFIPALKWGEKVTVAHLLSHCSGLPHWRPYYETIQKQNEQNPRFLGSEAAKQAVYEMAHRESLIAPVGTFSRYSDIGFILLGEILEKVSGLPLDRFCNDRIFSKLFCRLFFQRFGKERPGLFAATEDVPWRGGILCGKVHDENCYVMGGVSGHAGLFGSAQEVYTLVKSWRDSLKGEGWISPEMARKFVTRYEDKATVFTSGFGLGWDTLSPVGSSAGQFFSRSSWGHLGFTGTSIWVDSEQELIVILLTNRVHPSRSNDRIKSFRPELHDLIYKEMISE